MYRFVSTEQQAHVFDLSQQASVIVSTSWLSGSWPPLSLWQQNPEYVWRVERLGAAAGDPDTRPPGAPGDGLRFRKPVHSCGNQLQILVPALGLK